MFENVDNTHIHNYGRQRHSYTISSPMSLKAQVDVVVFRRTWTDAEENLKEKSFFSYFPLCSCLNL